MHIVSSVHTGIMEKLKKSLSPINLRGRALQSGFIQDYWLWFSFGRRGDQTYFKCFCTILYDNWEGNQLQEWEAICLVLATLSSE